MNYSSAILSLLALKGIGPRTVEQILSEADPGHFDNLGDFRAYALEHSIKKFPEISHEQVQGIEAETNRILETINRERIVHLHRWSDEFPPLLKSIPNAPIHLFVIGNVECLRQPGIAVVGTREPTTFGRKSAEKIAGRGVDKGFCVNSGLAEGCDTHGHIGALDAGGHTVAVLAHGFGTIYPRSNTPLSERIVDCGGALVTEYLPGEPGHPTKFVARDRIQSGLSLGTIVIETDVKGGTMHTVEFTQKQGRVLGAVDHPEKYRHEPKTHGNRQLIDEGLASSIGNSEELEAFFMRLKAPVPEESKRRNAAAEQQTFL